MHFPINFLSQQIVNTVAESKGIIGPKLIKKIKILSPGLTKQAIYANLRQLIKTEIVIKQKRHYSLSHPWLKKLESFTTQYLCHIKNSLPSAQLEEGDRLSYKFNSGYHADIYWAHLFDFLFTAQPADVPVIIYSPHEWFLLIRKESEEFIFNSFTNNKKKLLFIIGGSTPLDKAVKKKWTNDFVQIHTGKTYGIKNTSYFNVFHDTIIEVRFTDQLTSEINKFYKTNKKITPKNLVQLEKIVKKNYQIKLIISKNKKRADILRKRISKDFYVPKTHRALK